MGIILYKEINEIPKLVSQMNVQMKQMSQVLDRMNVGTKLRYNASKLACPAYGESNGLLQFLQQKNENVKIDELYEMFGKQGKKLKTPLKK